MSVPFFRFFPTDFEADTAHLTLVEDGAYNRLLRLCWMTPGCSLPDDEAWIFRRMRAHSEEEKRAVRVVLAEFFIREKETQRVSNKRLTQEYEYAQTRRDVAAKNGAKGGRPKASLKNNEKQEPEGLANRKLKKANQNQNQNQIEKEDTNVSSQKGTRLPACWVLPADWGDWAMSEGWPEGAIRLEAEKFRDYWHSKTGSNATKRDWQATWRNWMRNSNSPKVINGGHHGGTADKSQRRIQAFLAGAKGTGTAP